MISSTWRPKKSQDFSHTCPGLPHTVFQVNRKQKLPEVLQLLLSYSINQCRQNTFLVQGKGTWTLPLKGEMSRHLCSSLIFTTIDYRKSKITQIMWTVCYVNPEIVGTNITQSFGQFQKKVELLVKAESQVDMHHFLAQSKKDNN